jgi:hypothetical protein
MKFIKIIILLAAIIPFMFILSGCYGDAFLDAMKEEEDFIAPFDVVLTDEDAALRTTYFPIPGVNTSSNYTVNPDGDGNATLAVDGDDNVVLDNTTGLMWTRCTAIDKDTMDNKAYCSEIHAPMEWIYAVEFCKIKMNAVKYRGHEDWRLPRVSELNSIVSYNNSVSSDPAINITVFPGTVNIIDQGYWTFTSKLFIGDYYETIDHGWVIYFKQSNPGFQSGAAATNNVDFKRKLKGNLLFEKQYVRCVRGGIKDPF